MYEVLRHPKRNAAILGLLQGVPQGFALPEQKQLVFLDQNIWLVVCFGFIVPPVLIAIGHFRNKPPHPWWGKVMEYLDPILWFFWGCLSFAVCGGYALWRSGASEGYGMVAFFGVGAFGFLLGKFLERRLARRGVGNAI